MYKILRITTWKIHYNIKRNKYFVHDFRYIFEWQWLDFTSPRQQLRHKALTDTSLNNRIGPGVEETFTKILHHEELNYREHLYLIALHYQNIISNEFLININALHVKRSKNKPLKINLFEYYKIMEHALWQRTRAC